MKPRLIVVGTGGHARVVVEAVRAAGDWDLAGIVDRAEPRRGELVGGVAVIGTFGTLAGLRASGVTGAALALGDNAERSRMHRELRAAGFELPVLRHPTAIVAGGTSLGEGALVCAGAILAAEVRVGCGAIVNTGAIVDHECVLGDHAHVAPGSRLAGRVRVGERTLVGIGSTVREKVTIGADVVVGAGSVVLSDLPDGVTAYGVPARVVRNAP